MSKRNEDWLRLEVADMCGDVDVEAFLDVFQNTLRILRGLNRSVAKSGQETLDWRIVEIGSGSPVFAKVRGISNVSRNGDDGPQVIASFLDGLSHLNDSDDCPPFFTEDTLDCTRKIVASKARGISRVTYEMTGRMATVSTQVGRNAATAIRRLENQRGSLSGQHIERGSIEGTLATLSSKQGDRIDIVDSLTGESIPCYFSGEELDELARRAWKGRVVVSGELRIDRTTGNPTSVRRVEKITILPICGDLPQLEDIEGIDITGGRESSEYIGELRDAK